MHPIEKRHLNLGKHSVGAVLLEVGMIVFSILLALGLESWISGRHERALTREALHNIRLEMTRNREAVQAAVPRQEKLLADLDAVIGRGGREVPEEPLSMGLMPPRLFKTAWETAATTQSLVKADYALVLLIAQPYDSQRWMAMVEEKWLQAILNPAAFDQNNRLRFLQILRSVTAEYLALEKRLIPEYDQAVAKLGED